MKGPKLSISKRCILLAINAVKQFTCLFIQTKNEILFVFEVENGYNGTRYRDTK